LLLLLLLRVTKLLPLNWQVRLTLDQRMKSIVRQRRTFEEIIENEYFWRYSRPVVNHVLHLELQQLPLINVVLSNFVDRHNVQLLLVCPYHRTNEIDGHFRLFYVKVHYRMRPKDGPIDSN